MYISTMRKFIFIFIINFISLTTIGEAVKVSFYGASHIAMPVQEAKISTNIRLRFRTQQTSSLILLAAGRTDYCLLTMESGRIKLIYKINEHHAELWSPKAITLNDLEWHDVAISRYESNITMQVNEHFIRKTLPQKIGELNIHFGVFIGGVGEFSASYLSTMESYRGCISDVYYNNINVFKRARERSKNVESVKVSWNCAAEFDAGIQESISFIEEDAFMMMQKQGSKTGETWSLELRTIESMGSILSNIGNTNRHDFLTVEIVDGKLRLLVAKGANTVELVPDKIVSDGKWHNISISFNPNFVEIILDDIVNHAAFANGSSQIIELSEDFFIGGIDEPRRRRATLKGFRSSEYSFTGCLRNIFTNHQQIGFPSMKITHGVTVDCVWKYSCIEKLPCIISASCHQYGIDEFICSCDQAYCMRSDFTSRYKIFSRVAQANQVELIGVNPIQLLENDSIYLSPLNIEVLFDYSKLGIPENEILFYIVQFPKFGSVAIAHDNSSTGGNTKYFSFADLSNDRVKYIHNGGENFSDHLTIDLQLETKNNKIPETIQGKHRFVLHFNITPVNDKPNLYIPANRILRLTQGIPKIIENDILQADDPDSQPASLIYTIKTPPHGIFEMSGKQTLTFSQEEINRGAVTYIVPGPNENDLTYEIELTVSDGMETSNSVLLKVFVVPLQLHMINNTGLVLVHKSQGIITPWNLSFITNSEDDNVNMQFDIVQQPQYGVLQKVRTVDQSWIAVNSFTTSQIALGQIRYLHTLEMPQYDEFKFTVSLGPIQTGNYDFRITFTKLVIGIQQQIDLHLNGTSAAIISCDFLFHQTTPILTFSKNIIYTVIKPPKYGVIYIEGHPEIAEPMDSFTQYEIDRNLLRFRTYKTSYSNFSDIFEFTVTVPECEMVEGKINIIYTPTDLLINQLSYQIRDNIIVSEGDRQLLSRRHFDILFNNNPRLLNNLVFKLSDLPQFGSLCTYDHRTSNVFPIQEFTLDNLYLDDVYYCHDDSETTKDEFSFLIVSSDKSDFQYVSEIEVEIKLLNDNGPYRVFDQVFHIVRSESKILSGYDLKYSDPDVNTTTEDIFYTRIGVTNGELIRTDNGFGDSFTQSDLDNRKITLRHTGGDYGRINFIVTDGLYEVPGSLEIEASDPFLKIKETNASVVQEGKFVVITSTELSIETNLNSKSDEIEYHILEEPKYGLIKLLNQTSVSSTKNFTQLDIDNGKLAYYNVEVASMDRIKYRVSTKGIWSEGEILIRIYPIAYWELLKIKRNQTLYVEESTSVKITRNILEIYHPSISPGDITYLVTQSPHHGYLEIQSITSDDEYNCKVFDQSTVNSEKMYYIQAGVNQSSDYFVFDVTNGITWLKDLWLKIIIIPEFIYIKTKTIVVEEGKNILIQPDHMVPISEYFVSKITEYKIIQQPTFGELKSGKSQVKRFTQKQLESGVVYYVHDGSENATDRIQLIAITKFKESAPFDLNIAISPVNDEVPLVVTNTGLHVWIGGRKIITNVDLMAQDYDTAADSLRFVIRQVKAGYIALSDDFKVIINNFTQAQINEGKVYFIHDSNQMHSAYIRFYVTDDVHNTTEHVLEVISNPVALEEIKNENLHVFPMTRKTITIDQLQYRCSDHEREVKYIVKITPQMGRIFYEHIESGSSIEVNEFTQSDIDHGRIVYEHTHPMAELKSNDSFTFDVASFLAQNLIDQIFYIDISVSSGGLLRFLPVPKINVDEGDISPIKLDLSKILEYLETRAGIQAPELSVESYKPNFGQIELIDFDNSNKNKRHSNKFNINDFNSGKVIYRHDHSDSLEDKISMSIYLLPGQIFLCNITIPVTINPINDQPFDLITKTPIISVVEGENKTITKLDLYTQDADTDSKDILYVIISGPRLGTLLKISDEGIPVDLITYGNQFSQKDINDNRIIYSHSGPPQSTTFYFRVTDGKFTPLHVVFNITVLRASINVDTNNNEILYVQQGFRTSLLETKHISINTNVHRGRLMYNVTRTPSGGLILLKNNPTLRFSHAELEKEDVSYTQTDNNKSNDTFQLNVHIPNTNYAIAIDIQVIVEPFIVIKPISILAGDKIRLSSIFQTDPSQLTIIKYNPKFIITKKPKYGKFKKIIRNSGEIVEHGENQLRDITSFTYKEVKSGIIYFIARKQSSDDFVSINDSFEYILQMKSIPPGQKIIPIEIYSRKRLLMHENDNVNMIPTESRAIDTDYILWIVIIAVSLLLIIIVIIVIVKCIFRPRKPKKDHPPTLPRPDLMTMSSTNNSRGIYSVPSESDSMPVTAASTPLPVLSNVPHCKVYPIGLEPDMHDSETDEMMINEMSHDNSGAGLGRYPYGVDDTDDWNSNLDGQNEVSYSNIAQQPTQNNNQTLQHPRNNPLLRRNQYWV